MQSSPSGRPPLVNRYMAQIGSAPLAEGNQAIFIWRGSAQKVQLAGDMSGWNVEKALEMTPLEGTDLWYYRAQFEPDARLDYQFLVDGIAQPDPLNPQRAIGRLEPASELAMPGHITPPELDQLEMDVPAGGLRTHTIDSIFLNQTRTFFVYSPPGQVVGQKLPVLYINDGGDYLNLIDAPAILDRFIALRLGSPLLAVFIPPISAEDDYMLNDGYVSFLAEELAPFIHENYDASSDPGQNGILGSAYGGLAAVYTALKRPDVIGLAAGQSAAFNAGDNSLVRNLADIRRQDNLLESAANLPRFYLVVGSYENDVLGLGDVLSANRMAVDRLRSASYQVVYDERHEGHGWALWRGTLGQTVIQLFGD